MDTCFSLGTSNIYTTALEVLNSDWSEGVGLMFYNSMTLTVPQGVIQGL